MRKDYAETVKTLFTEAIRPQFLLCSTRHSGKVERLSVLKVLKCAAVDVAEALRVKYPATQKKRRVSGQKDGTQVYTLAALFSMTRTNFLKAMSKIEGDSWKAEAFDCVPASVKNGASWGDEESARWHLQGRRWNLTVPGRRGVMRAVRGMRTKLGLSVRTGSDTFAGEQMEQATSAHVAFIHCKVRFRLSTTHGWYS